MRRKVVEPVYDTKAGWEIFRQLALRLEMEEYFPHKTIEEIWEWQLEPTGFSIADFGEKGFVELADKPIFIDRDKLDGKFKTPSGKIEIISQKLTDAGLESFIKFKRPDKPPKGKFRLVYGRSAVHTHGHTINNPLLYELMPENTLWINTKVAGKLGIFAGDLVDVMAGNGFKQRIKAHIVDFIHPECVYTNHGFGRQVPLQSRAYHAGLSDQKLMVGLLDKWDPAGGGISLCESFVSVRRSARNQKMRVGL
jgi:thiosulfate reductase/polysulfide reductase chain A